MLDIFNLFFAFDAETLNWVYFVRYEFTHEIRKCFMERDIGKGSSRLHAYHVQNMNVNSV